jgi:cyclase
MLMPRVIPCLLLKGEGLVKTCRFRDPVYLGDPINVVKIFNDKEVDELFLLDITATAERRGPRFELLEVIAQEAFMPLGYGGGIRRLEDVKRLLELGLEKVTINSYAVENPAFVTQAADYAGSQSIVVSIDVKRNWRGRLEVVTEGAKVRTGLDPVDFAREMARCGAGEILLTSVDRDGTLEGYDIELARHVTDVVGVPVVVCGGARDAVDLRRVIREGGASGAAAGAMFVFKGPHRAVLISYPSSQELRELFSAA